jgi:hypothetical protein
MAAALRTLPADTRPIGIASVGGDWKTEREQYRRQSPEEARRRAAQLNREAAEERHREEQAHATTQRQLDEQTRAARTFRPAASPRRAWCDVFARLKQPAGRFGGKAGQQ